jgi:hypothetical protein
MNIMDEFHLLKDGGIRILGVPFGFVSFTFFFFIRLYVKMFNI